MINKDWHTKAGAEALAETIRAYWKRKGRTVEVWIEPEAFCYAMREEWYSIRSNIAGSLGPKRPPVSTAIR